MTAMPPVLDVESIPFRWLVAVFGEEEARFFNAHPEHVPADVADALLALQKATFHPIRRSK